MNGCCMSESSTTFDSEPTQNDLTPLHMLPCTADIHCDHAIYARTGIIHESGFEFQLYTLFEGNPDLNFLRIQLYLLVHRRPRFLISIDLPSRHHSGSGTGKPDLQPARICVGCWLSLITRVALIMRR